MFGLEKGYPFKNYRIWMTKWDRPKICCSESLYYFTIICSEDRQ